MSEARMSGAIRLAYTKCISHPKEWFTCSDVRVQKVELDRLVEMGVLQVRRDLPTPSSFCFWRYKVNR